MPSPHRRPPVDDQSTPGPRTFPCPGGCGGHRKEGFAFCGACYHKLPRNLQGPLYRMAGTAAFAKAMQDAKAYLAARRG